MDFAFLYIGTSAMLFLSFCLIGFVVWATSAMKKQRIFAEQRDKNLTERMNGVEALVRTEFKAVFEQLKIFLQK